MTRIVGIVLLLLAVMATVNVAKKLSRPTGFSNTGNRSYDAGHKAGMLSAPIILGGVGL